MKIEVLGIACLCLLCLVIGYVAGLNTGQRDTIIRQVSENKDLIIESRNLIETKISNLKHDLIKYEELTP